MRESLVGEEHHTISNLRTYAGQFTQRFAKISIANLGQAFQIQCAGRDLARGGQ